MSLAKTIKSHLKQYGINAKARNASGQEYEVIWVTVPEDAISKTRELVKEFEGQAYAIFVQS